MSCPSSPVDIEDTLVLDTSVLINLHACRYGDRVAMAIPNDILVPAIVAGELEHETSRKNGDRSFLQALVEGGIVALADLTDAEYEIFHKLTSASPSLDDGEAATIAIASSRYLLPVIDERRGRLRASILMEGQLPGWSLDLFRHPAVIAALGDQFAVEALYFALRDGRMRIPPGSVEGVIGIIGETQARDCTCLPGYRDRFINI